MSQKPGRGTRGRATKSTTSTTSQQETLPHAQASTSTGAVRRPGTQPGTTTGRGVIQRVGEKGDAAIGQLGRGVEKLGIQSTVTASGPSGDADTSTVAARTGTVVSSTRGAARGKRILPADLFVTKPSHVVNKKGTSGAFRKIKVNYFQLIKTTNWALYQYHVDFAPEEDRTIVRKGLLKLHQQEIGAYIYDGTVMYTSRRLFDRKIFTSKRKSDEAIITITVRLVGDMVVGDPHYLQFFNIIMRKCYESLKLKLVGRNYFDPGNKIVLPETRLEVWPGYVSSIRQHERDILMCVDVISKIMRLETLLDVLNQCYREYSDKYKENFCKAVIGIVVLTDYNNNTYRIEDVDFSTSPSHTFDMRGEKISYVEYYKKKYGLKISNLTQPMLVSTSKQKSREAAEPQRIYLVPEFCRPTGLTDSMRENHRLMAGVAVETRLSAARRIEKLINFNRSICRSPAIMQDLSHWDLKLDDRLLEVDGRQLPTETIWVARNKAREGINPERGDWTKSMHNKECIHAPELNNWTLIITDRDRNLAQNFITALLKAARGLNFDMKPPTVFPIRDDRPGTYNAALEEILSKDVIQLVFCVVSNIRSDRYSAIKKKCCVDRPVPSQVCLFKTMTHRNIMSIATKIAIQMNCKIGGAPWHVDIPLEGMMTIGFDVCHDTTVKSKDFGAMVATLDKQMTKYYSAVSAHENGEELSNDICNNICKAAQAYYERNQRLPSRIVIYRDGVGEGQISQVMEREVQQIKKKLDDLYRGPDKYRMAFIIVTKRLNTRLFCNNDNPDPGTIVDDVITSPIKYDFFLVSQKVRQGTVTPTSYNVVYDNLGLDPDKIQRLSYKLTHMYFNCSNTVRVPAPCHYAHKLAFLVSKFIHRAPDTQLQNTLYFL